MKTITNSVYKSFRVIAESSLKGDWVLLGGSLLPVLGIESRLTTDIDLVPLGSTGNSSLSQTFQFAEKAHLPIEAVNSAALYFLEKIPHFREHLILLHEWKEGRLFRPDLYLFFTLKLGRFTESDYLDCLNLLQFEGSDLNKNTRKSLSQLLNEKKKTFKGDRQVWVKELIETLLK